MIGRLVGCSASCLAPAIMGCLAGCLALPPQAAHRGELSFWTAGPDVFNRAWLFEWSCSCSWSRTAVLVPVYQRGRTMTREAMGGGVRPPSRCVVECESVKNADDSTGLGFFLAAVHFDVFSHQLGFLPLSSAAAVSLRSYSLTRASVAPDWYLEAH